MEKARDPWRDLAAMVLLKAVEDLKGNNVTEKHSARNFLKSEWGAILLTFLGLDPIAVRERLGLKTEVACEG